MRTQLTSVFCVLMTSIMLLSVASSAMADDYDTKCKVTVSYDDHLYHFEKSAKEVADKPSGVIEEACKTACADSSDKKQTECFKTCKKSAKLNTDDCLKKTGLGVEQVVMECSAVVVYNNDNHKTSIGISAAQDVNKAIKENSCKEVCSKDGKISSGSASMSECMDQCKSKGEFNSISCKFKGNDTPESSYKCLGKVSFDNDVYPLNLIILDNGLSKKLAFNASACIAICDPKPDTEKESCLKNCMNTSQTTELQCASGDESTYGTIKTGVVEEKLCTANILYNDKNHTIKAMVPVKKNGKQGDRMIIKRLRDKLCSELCGTGSDEASLDCDSACRHDSVVSNLKCFDKPTK